MKKLFFASCLFLFLCLGFFQAQAQADRLIIKYCVNNKVLRVEYLGSKLHSWGPNDVECIQLDRVRGVDSADLGQYDPQIFLEIYDGRSPKRVSWVYQLPLGREIIFYAEASNVQHGKTFQIFADVWTGGQIQRKYWALGPGEPIPANLILYNVEKVADGNGGFVFRTCCHSCCH